MELLKENYLQPEQLHLLLKNNRYDLIKLYIKKRFGNFSEIGTSEVISQLVATHQDKDVYKFINYLNDDPENPYDRRLGLHNLALIYVYSNRMLPDGVIQDVLKNLDDFETGALDDIYDNIKKTGQDNEYTDRLEHEINKRRRKINESYVLNESVLSQDQFKMLKKYNKQNVIDKALENPENLKNYIRNELGENYKGLAPLPIIERYGQYLQDKDKTTLTTNLLVFVWALDAHALKGEDVSKIYEKYVIEPKLVDDRTICLHADTILCSIWKGRGFTLKATDDCVKILLPYAEKFAYVYRKEEPVYARVLEDLISDIQGYEEQPKISNI